MVVLREWLVSIVVDWPTVATPFVYWMRLERCSSNFRYEDEWYPSTDGMGRSLVLTDREVGPEAWGEASSWSPSAFATGSPGADDPGGVEGGMQLPADANQDAQLDLTDGVALLNLLFSESAPSPACDGATVVDGGNLQLHDVNGDSSVNVTDVVSLLNYLFLNGARPVLGTECVPISGCRDLCRG